MEKVLFEESLLQEAIESSLLDGFSEVDFEKEGKSASLEIVDQDEWEQ